MKFLTTSAAVLCIASIAHADTRMKVRYTTNGEITETTVYTKGVRQRLEYPDVIVIQQPDQQRLLQLDPKSKAYTTLPANTSVAATPAPAGLPRKGSVVMVTTATSSTGETRQILGRTAKHIKTVTTQQPMPGACDTTQASLEIDGWYADLGERRVDSPAAPPSPAAAGCTDDYRAQSTGETNTGFPLAYTITSRQGSKTVTTSMEVLDLSTDTLDAALFEAPADWAGAKDTSELARLQVAAFVASAPAKTGPVRIGVMIVTDQSGKGLNQDFLVEQFRHALAGSGVDAVRVYDAAQAKQANCDYLLTGEVLELKRNAINQVAGQAAKVSGLLRGGLMGGLKGGGAAAAGATTTQSSDESVEAKLNYKLTPLDSTKAETTGTVMARSGAIISLKTAITLASNFTPMLMMAQMYSNPMMMQMMNTSMVTQQSTMSLDPAMSGMNSWTRATNALSASQSPGASDAKAVNAAFDMIAKAISTSAK